MPKETTIGSVFTQLFGITSALHSYPEPIPEKDLPEENLGFMDENDAMIAHAQSHARKAIHYCAELARQEAETEILPHVRAVMAKIDAFEEAVREHAFMGSNRPECFDGIEKDFIDKKAELFDAIFPKVTDPIILKTLSEFRKLNTDPPK